MHSETDTKATITKMYNRVSKQSNKLSPWTFGFKCNYLGFGGYMHQQISRLDVKIVVDSVKLACTREPKKDTKEKKTKAGFINLGCQNIRQLNGAKMIINRRQPCGEALVQHLSPYSLVKLAQVCLLLLIISASTTKCSTNIRLEYFRPEHVSGGDSSNMLPAQPLVVQESRAFSRQRGAQQHDWKFPRNIKEIITNMDTSTDTVSTTMTIPRQRHQPQQKKPAIDNNKALALLDHAQSDNDPISTSKSALATGYLLKRATDALNEANNKLANQTGTAKVTTTFPPAVISNGDKRKESFGEMMRPLQESVNQTVNSGRHPSQFPDNGQQQNNVLATKIALLAPKFGNSLRSQEAKLDEQRSESVQKQKFTIKANGKELALELPSLLPMKGADSNHLTSNGLLPGQETKSKGNSNLRKKDNRIGEFLNSDDSGFDEGESTANSAPSTSSGAATIDFDGSSKPHPTSLANQSNLEPPTAPSSSSSSLMSTRNDNENDSDDNDDSKSALSSDGAKLEPIGRSGGRNDNNIISEWSKSGSRPLASVDRHPSKSKGLAQSNSRFSALISGGDAGSSLNDGSNQSREPQALHLWDIKQSSFSKQAVKSKLSNKMVNATAAPAGDKESGYGKGSIRRHTYPKAPVFAKARYAPMTATKSSYSDQGEKSSAGEESSKSGKGESNDALNVNTDKQSFYLLNGFSSSSTSASSSPLPTDLVNPIRATTHLDKSFSAGFTRNNSGGPQNTRPSPPMLNGVLSNYDNRLSVEQPSSTFEYKANYTNLIRSLDRHRKMMLNGPNVDDGKKIAEVKAPIFQRDISYKNLMQPFIAPNYQNDLIKSLPLNQDLVSLTDALHQRLQNGGDSGLKYQQPISRNSYGNSNDSIGQQMNKDLNTYSGMNQNLRRTSGTQQPLPSMTQPVAFLDTNRGHPNERTNSIIRMGPIMPHLPRFGNHHHYHHHNLKSLVPAAVALLAHAQEEQRNNNHLRALINHHQHNQAQQPHLATGNDAFLFPQPQHRSNLGPFNLTQEPMVANSNQLGVSHLGPQSITDQTPQFGMREFTDRNNIPGPSPSTISDSSGNVESSNLGPNTQGSSSLAHSGASSNMMGGSGEEQRLGGFGDIGNDNYSYEPNSSLRMNVQLGIAGGANTPSRPSTSRSSISDVYYGQESKSSREASGGGYPMRSGSIDPYEDISTGISTSEYERDLADLDEEFNRNTYRRPPSMISDSYMNTSPSERYEGGGRGGVGRYSRRPSYDYSPDYMSTTGSLSSVLPRSYHRQHSPHSLWSSASTSSSYGEPSDLWSEAGADFTPVGSYNPYSYKWPPTRVTFPRYSRTYSPYLSASATESHPLNPYSIYSPSYTSALPTETVSFTLSPLAAAAAAAASALAAADKSRHNHPGAWLTIPRLATTSTIAAPVTTSAATNAHPTTTIPAAAPPALPTAYIHRPYANPYALASMPFYAIAPRPAAHTLTTATGQPAGHQHPSIISYPYGGAPALFAYRPAGVPIMPSSLLTAASFAYPMRLPMAGLPRYTMGVGPTRVAGSGVGVMRHPFYSDLQFAETKSKSNSTSNGENGSSSGGGRGLPIKTVSASFTAMARNLTRKMFGQASQIRPLHVAPPQPSPLYDFFTSSHNSTFTL